MKHLSSIADSVSTGSTNRRIQIFRHEIPTILTNSEMSSEIALALVDAIFKTLYIYDDKGSRKAVDDVVVTNLSEVTFMKSFAAALVQCMEKQLKLQSHTGCYILLKWSCLLLSKSQFASLSKNALSKIASVQASVLHIVKRASFRERRACKKKFLHLLSESPDIYKSYMEELKEARIPFKDSPEFVQIMLEFSISNPTFFDQWKTIFLDMYVKAILNAKEKPDKDLSEAFCPLFSYLGHEDFKNIVFPSSVKMLKRNPELVLESVGILLKSTNLDLSKFAVEILSVVLPQARHADELRRLAALDVVRCLSLKSSNPDSVESMFYAIKSVIGGSEGRLAFPYQRVGMVNALKDLSNSTEGKYLTNLSPTVCAFLLSCYKEDGNEEVKLACLSALGSWAARSADAVQPDLISVVTSGIKEKEAIRRGHLRCLRVMSEKADTVVKMSSLVLPLVQLVKTGFSKAAQRLDGIYALLILAKITAVDIKADEIVLKEKVWSLISQNESSLVPISLVSKLAVVDCMACVDLVEVLLVDHSHRVLEAVPAKSLSQLILFFICHPSWDIRKAAYDLTKRDVAAFPQLSEALLLEFSNYLSVVAEKLIILKTSDTEAAFVPSVEVLVKALNTISSTVLTGAPKSCIQIQFCAHHPCLIGSAKQNSVWRRLQKCLQKLGFDIIGLIKAELRNSCKTGNIKTRTCIAGVGNKEEIAVVCEGRCTTQSVQYPRFSNINCERDEKLYPINTGGLCSGSGDVHEIKNLVARLEEKLCNTKGKPDILKGMTELHKDYLKKWVPCDGHVVYPCTVKHYAFTDKGVSFIELSRLEVPYEEQPGDEYYYTSHGSGSFLLKDFLDINKGMYSRMNKNLSDMAAIIVCEACLKDPNCGGFLQTARILRGEEPTFDIDRPHFLSVVAKYYNYFSEYLGRSFLMFQWKYLPKYLDEAILSDIWARKLKPKGLVGVKVLCQCDHLELVVRIFTFSSETFEKFFKEAKDDAKKNIFPDGYVGLAKTQAYRLSEIGKVNGACNLGVENASKNVIAGLGKKMENSMKDILKGNSKKSQKNEASTSRKRSHDAT